MAIPKSTRSSPGSTRSRRSVLPHRPGAAVSGSEASSTVCSVTQFRRLSLLLRRFRTIYGTALAAELALRHQAAEQDSEVADCLRVGVCDPIADQARELEGLILEFSAAIPRGER
ncbi:MAG: hypothetical protein WA624_03340 [Methylocella sp.]